METNVAPADVARAEHGAQLIREAEWLEDVPVATTLAEITAGRIEQRPHALPVTRQLGPFVVVAAKELVLDEVGAGLFGNFLSIRAREQERRRINRRPPQRVNRHRPPQQRQHTGPQRIRIEPRTARLRDHHRKVLESRPRHHYPSFAFGGSTCAATS